jgi:hypothetical protein
VGVMSMFSRAARGYGQASCAVRQVDGLVGYDPGASGSSATVRPKPPCSAVPIPTRAVMLEPPKSRLRPAATRSSAFWKQAAQPIAKSSPGY